LQRGELGAGVVELVKAGELGVASGGIPGTEATSMAGGEEGAEVAAVVEELGFVEAVGSAVIVLLCRHELGKPPSAALISSRLQEENSRTT